MTTPLLTPVTTPPDTVATDVAELLHAPPPVVLLNVIVEPTQADEGPVIDAGPATTVTVAMAVHDVPSE